MGEATVAPAGSEPSYSSFYSCIPTFESPSVIDTCKLYILFASPLYPQLFKQMYCLGRGNIFGNHLFSALIRAFELSKVSSHILSLIKILSCRCAGSL